MVCPECNGRGEAIYYVETDRDENTVTVEKRKGTCRNCNGSGEKQQTNADRIRAMSDEQLAKFLLDVEQGNFSVDCCDDRFCNTQNCCHDCAEAAIKWLKQPAEDNYG